jgi:hypothetical protein
MVTGDNATALQTNKTNWEARSNAPTTRRPKDTIEAAVATITKSGDGTTTVFTYAHGLGAAPAQVFLSEKNAVSAALHHWTWDATNVTITFVAAPANAANNIVFGALLVY